MSERENAMQLERDAFDQRLAIEAAKAGVSVEEFREDYAREENAAREVNPLEQQAAKDVYETGPVSGIVERQIKETILARIAASRDHLTGLHNKAFLETQLRKRHTEGEKGQFSLIMIDIDHFKKINDTYGHDAGDFILREVSQLLNKNMRYGDSLARFGGEEIAVIAPNANGDAPAFAERLRKVVEEGIFKYKDADGKETDIKVTISAGVAPYDRLEKMLQMSDNALYKAKGNRDADENTEEVIPGRNQVWYFDKNDSAFKRFQPKPNKD